MLNPEEMVRRLEQETWILVTYNWVNNIISISHVLHYHGIPTQLYKCSVVEVSSIGKCIGKTQIQKVDLLPNKVCISKF